MATTRNADNCRPDGTKIYSCSSQLSRLMHVVFLSLDLFTANGAAGSEQTEVGLGFSHATWFHWALLVQAEDLPIHQTHPEKTCPDICCSLCHRWGTESILYQAMTRLYNYIGRLQKYITWCHFKVAYCQHIYFQQCECHGLVDSEFRLQDKTQIKVLK